MKRVDTAVSTLEFRVRLLSVTSHMTEMPAPRRDWALGLQTWLTVRDLVQSCEEEMNSHVHTVEILTSGANQGVVKMS